MTNDNNSSMQHDRDRKGMKNHGSSGIAGAAYFMAFIGAAVITSNRQPLSGPEWLVS